MKAGFLIAWFTLGCLYLYAQEPVLKLKTRKPYQLYFIDVSIKEMMPVVDSIRSGVVTWDSSYSFVVDDPVSIHALSKNWTGVKTNEVYFCGYNYYLYVAEDNKIVDELRINEECKQVVCRHGAFNFSNAIADKLNTRKMINVAWVFFDSVATGRQFYKEAKRNQQVFVPEDETDEWITYEGKIIISATGEDESKIQNKLESDLRKTFPGEAFKIKPMASGKGYLVCRIYCSRKMGINLKEYEIKEYWQSLKPSSIMLFSPEKREIENLLKSY